MQYWKAHYKDALHDADIVIMNAEDTAEPLSFTLDGIRFQGSSYADFHLSDETQYDAAKEKFCLLKWGGHYTKYHITTPYSYDLQRYALTLEIPVNIYRKRDGAFVLGTIRLAYQYTEHDEAHHQPIYLCDDTRVYRDEAKVSDFSRLVDGLRYESSRKSLFFEVALHHICTQIKEDYLLKCCFTCQYSDYSPYGSDDYGTMLCYRRYKEDCLRVNNKEEYFRYLEERDYDARQETYLCGQYSPRCQAAGYRGFVDGVGDLQKEGEKDEQTGNL